MKFEGDPLYIEIPDNHTLKRDGVTDQELRNGGNYKFCLKNDLANNKNIQIVFILISRDSDHPPIKKMMDEMGVIS
jgi:hypothetical protein